uniref:Uncharacterized protein n=1 Tax=viral metagenome TaxID=1070528 RepID=A0A6M3JIB9_9ZZZZ
MPKPRNNLKGITRKDIERGERLPKDHHIADIEKETIIIWNEAEPLAEYFTYNKVIQKHFKQVLGIKPYKDNGYGGEFYHIEKKRIPLPRKPKQLTPEQRKRIGERLRKSLPCSANSTAMGAQRNRK